MKPVLFLIDGHAQLYREFYAVLGLTSPDGRPTGAAFGFVRMLFDLLNNHSPAALVAVFDSPGKTFRHDEYEAYKANRKPAPPELKEQIPLVRDILDAYGVPVYAVEGYEADDILGTLTRKALAEGWAVTLVTGDKDCGQLLADGVRIFNYAGKEFTDRSAFIEKKGIPPEKLPDVMGLWGDSSDNIPGVPGIGEKIGIELIRQYGSLENLLERAGEVKGKRGEVLRANVEQAKLSKKLATIDVDVPVELDLEAAKPRAPDIERLKAIFRDLGFNAFLQRLEKDAPSPVEELDYRLVDTREKFDAFLDELARQSFFALDTETTGLEPLRDDLVGMSFSWRERHAFYLPFRCAMGDRKLSPDELARLKPILESPDVGKTGHNIRFDALVLKHAGVDLAGVRFDSLIASSLASGHMTEHGLDALAKRYYGITMQDIKELIGSGKAMTTMDRVPAEAVVKYACADADIAFRLRETLSPLLDKRGCRRLFDEVEMPLSGVLTRMQATGIRLDPDLLAAESAETEKLLESLTREIYDLAGREFNIASPKQLAEVLFDQMGLPVVRRGKTGPSTDESVLQELAMVHQAEIAVRILEHRAYAKLKNTYLDALPKLINPDTGRLHTSFSQTRTATGRLASSNPNLQNIPVRTERGRAVRAAFIPESGWKMLAADYSQVELRVLAHYAKDETLIQAFKDDQDIHRVVAALVNGVTPERVTKDMRSAAKAVNFGIIYGQSAHGLSETTGMSRAVAQRFIDDYFARFPRVHEWIEGVKAKAAEEGAVETMLGFRREIPEIKAANVATRSRGQREAVNTIIQGTAADLIKTAMVRLDNSLRSSGLSARLLLQIHDELLLECPPGELPALEGLVRDAMENAFTLDIPLKVDVGTGDNWLETK